MIRLARALARLMTCGIQLRLSHVWMRVARQEYIYIYLQNSMSNTVAAAVQRCGARVCQTYLFACTFVGTMVGTYPIRTV